VNYPPSSLCFLAWVDMGPIFPLIYEKRKENKKEKKGTRWKTIFYCFSAFLGHELFGASIDDSIP
jgi:hypothetical protein